jgi:putative exosortase-associated protein (TIGR04073 family)
MQNKILLWSAAMALGVMATGCANVEKKLGRGISNSAEIVRAGEFRRTMEQSALWDGPEYAYTTGFIHGVNRTLARTGIGIYEVITAPFPPYGPVATDCYAPSPVYPDNYKPGIMADSMFATDTQLGFSGGTILPWIPGNRYHIFEGP